MKRLKDRIPKPCVESVGIPILPFHELLPGSVIPVDDGSTVHRIRQNVNTRNRYNLTMPVLIANRPSPEVRTESPGEGPRTTKTKFGLTAKSIHSGRVRNARKDTWVAEKKIVTAGNKWWSEKVAGDAKKPCGHDGAMAEACRSAAGPCCVESVCKRFVATRTVRQQVGENHWRVLRTEHFLVLVHPSWVSGAWPDCTQSLEYCCLSGRFRARTSKERCKQSLDGVQCGRCELAGEPGSPFDHVLLKTEGHFESDIVQEKLAFLAQVCLEEANDMPGMTAEEAEGPPEARPDALEVYARRAAEIFCLRLIRKESKRRLIVFEAQRPSAQAPAEPEVEESFKAAEAEGRRKAIAEAEAREEAERQLVAERLAREAAERRLESIAREAAEAVLEEPAVEAGVTQEEVEVLAALNESAAEAAALEKSEAELNAEVQQALAVSASEAALHRDLRILWRERARKRKEATLERLSREKERNFKLKEEREQARSEAARANARLIPANSSLAVKSAVSGRATRSKRVPRIVANLTRVQRNRKRNNRKVANRLFRPRRYEAARRAAWFLDAGVRSRAVKAAKRRVVRMAELESAERERAAQAEKARAEFDEQLKLARSWADLQDAKAAAEADIWARAEKTLRLRMAADVAGQVEAARVALVRERAAVILQHAYRTWKVRRLAEEARSVESQKQVAGDELKVGGYADCWKKAFDFVPDIDQAMELGVMIMSAWFTLEGGCPGSGCPRMVGGMQVGNCELCYIDRYEPIEGVDRTMLHAGHTWFQLTWAGPNLHLNNYISSVGFAPFTRPSGEDWYSLWELKTGVRPTRTVELMTPPADLDRLWRGVDPHVVVCAEARKQAPLAHMTEPIPVRNFSTQLCIGMAEKFGPCAYRRPSDVFRSSAEITGLTEDDIPHGEASPATQWEMDVWVEFERHGSLTVLRDVGFCRTVRRRSRWLDFIAALSAPVVGVAGVSALLAEALEVHGTDLAKTVAADQFNSDYRSIIKTNYRATESELAAIAKYIEAPIISVQNSHSTSDRLFMDIVNEIVRDRLMESTPFADDCLRTLHLDASVATIRRYHSRPGHHFLITDKSRQNPTFVHDLTVWAGAKLRDMKLPNLQSYSGSPVTSRWDSLKTLVHIALSAEGREVRIHFDEAPGKFAELFAEESLVGTSPEEFAKVWRKYGATGGSATVFIPNRIIDRECVASDHYKLELYYEMDEEIALFVDAVWPVCLAFTPLFPAEVFNRYVEGLLKEAARRGWEWFTKWIEGLKTDPHWEMAAFGNIVDIVKFAPILRSIMKKCLPFFERHFLKARLIWRNAMAPVEVHKAWNWGCWLARRSVDMPGGRLRWDVADRVGEMYTLKFFEDDGSRPLQFSVELSRQQDYVKILDVESLWDPALPSWAQRLSAAKYLSVGRKDWEELVNWGLAEPAEALNMEVYQTLVNRVRGGLSIASNVLVQPMMFRIEEASKVALAALLEVFRRKNVIQMIEESENLRTAYQRNVAWLAEKLAGAVAVVASGGLAVPVYHLCRWLLESAPTIEFVKYHNEPEVIKVKARPVRKPKVEEGPVDVVVRASKETANIPCTLCRLQAMGRFSPSGKPADGQEFVTERHGETGDMTINVTPGELQLIISRVKDAKSWHAAHSAKATEHIRRFEHWLDANANGLHHKLRVEHIRGGPGTGKTEIIKSYMQYHNENGIKTSVVFPFRALQPDYINVNVLGGKKPVTLSANTLWYALGEGTVQHLLADEVTGIDWDILKCMAVYLGVNLLTLVGDVEQTHLDPGNGEGIDPLNPASMLDMSKVPEHQLVWNYRLDGWRTKMLNHVFGYKMKCRRPEDVCVPEFVTIDEYRAIAKTLSVDQQMVFNHVSAEPAFGVRSSQGAGGSNNAEDITVENLSVRSKQGKTFENVAVTAMMTDTVWNVHGMLCVAVSRAKHRTIFVCHDVNDPIPREIRAKLCMDTDAAVKAIGALHWPEVDRQVYDWEVPPERQTALNYVNDMIAAGKVEIDSISEVPALSSGPRIIRLDDVPAVEVMWEEKEVLLKYLEDQFAMCGVEAFKPPDNDSDRTLKWKKAKLELLEKVYYDDVLMGRKPGPSGLKTKLKTQEQHWTQMLDRKSLTKWAGTSVLDKVFLPWGTVRNHMAKAMGVSVLRIDQRKGMPASEYEVAPRWEARRIDVAGANFDFELPVGEVVCVEVKDSHVERVRPAAILLKFASAWVSVPYTARVDGIEIRKVKIVDGISTATPTGWLGTLRAPKATTMSQWLAETSIDLSAHEAIERTVSNQQAISELPFAPIKGKASAATLEDRTLRDADPKQRAALFLTSVFDRCSVEQIDELVNLPEMGQMFDDPDDFLSEIAKAYGFYDAWRAQRKGAKRKVLRNAYFRRQAVANWRARREAEVGGPLVVVPRSPTRPANRVRFEDQLVARIYDVAPPNTPASTVVLDVDTICFCCGAGDPEVTVEEGIPEILEAAEGKRFCGVHCRDRAIAAWTLVLRLDEQEVASELSSAVGSFRRVVPSGLSRADEKFATEHEPITSSWKRNVEQVTAAPVRNGKHRFGTDAYRLRSVIDPSTAILHHNRINFGGVVAGPAELTRKKLMWGGFIHQRTVGGKIRAFRPRTHRAFGPGLANHYENSPVESLIAAGRLGRKAWKPPLCSETKAFAEQMAETTYRNHFQNCRIPQEEVNAVVENALKVARQRSYDKRMHKDREALKFRPSLVVSNKPTRKPMKNDSLNLAKGGQVIVQSPPETNLRFIGWMRARNYRLKLAAKSHFFFDDFESAAAFRLRLNAGLRALPSGSRLGIMDFREFDSQQNKVTLHAEKHLAKLLGCNERSIEEYYRIRGDLDYIMHGLFSGRTRGEKGSGFLDTKMGNTLLATMLADQVFRGVGPRVVAAKGDDQLRAQVGLSIDEDAVKRVKRLTGMSFVCEVSRRGGEFIGCSVGQEGIYESVTRAAIKCICRPARDWKMFLEQQQSIRDKISEWRQEGFERVVNFSARAEKRDPNYVWACLEFLNSVTNMSRRQWEEATKVYREERFFLPSAAGPVLL